MVSLPAAVAKAVFDLLSDIFRNQKGIKSTPEREIPMEEGIEMHHVNTATPPGSSHSQNADDRNLTRRNKTLPQSESDDSDDTLVLPQSCAQKPPEIITLPAYLKEHFNKTKLRAVTNSFVKKFPTFSATLRRLPYALLPFAFSQFILVEALSYTGWINVFSNWLAIVVGFSLPATVFFVGVMSVILCNVSGTNIGATILLVKILKAPEFANRAGIPPKLETGGMLALAVGSNIGAVSFTFSASLAGISLLGVDGRITLERDITAEGDYC
jgi:hypothetical protein